MSETATIVGHLVLFATTCIGFWFQWKRDERNHQWQREELKSIKRTVENGVAH